DDLCLFLPASWTENWPPRSDGIQVLAALISAQKDNEPLLLPNSCSLQLICEVWPYLWPSIRKTIAMTPASSPKESFPSLGVRVRSLLGPKNKSINADSSGPYVRESTMWASREKCEFLNVLCQENWSVLPANPLLIPVMCEVAECARSASNDQSMESAVHLLRMASAADMGIVIPSDWKNLSLNAMLAKGGTINEVCVRALSLVPRETLGQLVGRVSDIVSKWMEENIGQVNDELSAWLLTAAFSKHQERWWKGAVLKGAQHWLSQVDDCILREWLKRLPRMADFILGVIGGLDSHPEEEQKLLKISDLI